MRVNTFEIKMIMAEREMSNLELAELCGIAYQNICTIMSRGTCLPKTAGKLAKALGVNVREIVKEENENA